jgi:hypothetical protein
LPRRMPSAFRCWTQPEMRQKERKKERKKENKRGRGTRANRAYGESHLYWGSTQVLMFTFVPDGLSRLDTRYKRGLPTGTNEHFSSSVYVISYSVT